jgi:hypothetical protein
MKLQVQLQGVSGTGYRVKGDEEDKKKLQMTQIRTSLIGEL